ncbi:RHS repeat-associated core domain-containing protein [Mucilaginibacter sp. HD30]
MEISVTGKEKLSFQYNGSERRAHMYYGGEQTDFTTRPFRRHYSEDGSMEITEDILTGKTAFVFYLGGDAYSAPAIWKHEQTSSGTAAGMYYLHRDYQGSILMITDATGTIREKRHFDAWGNIVKLTDGVGTNLSAFIILDRGYTGHEHLLGVALINMNGRLYDPLLHRFLGPDNFVQDVDNTQNFNRYGYALNNPLKYTDPSGEILFAFLAPVLGNFLTGVVTGAVLGGAAYTVSVALSPGGFKNWNTGQFLKAVGLSALSAGATGAIGNAFGAVGSASASGMVVNFLGATGNFGLELARAFTHGIVGGILSTAGGGSFGSGMLSGALSSLSSSALQSWAPDLLKSEIFTYLLAAGSGGIGEELGGGDFWRGAARGAIVAGLNHLDHLGPEPQQRGREVTLKSLAIKPGDTAEAMISKIIAGTKPGDYASGDLFSFINSKIGDYAKTITRVDGNNFRITTKGMITGLALRNNSTITISKVKSGDYKVSMNGLTPAGKKLFWETTYIKDNMRYMYDKNGMWEAKIGKK